jgi:hypothetical protein
VTGGCIKHRAKGSGYGLSQAAIVIGGIGAVNLDRYGKPAAGRPRDLAKSAAERAIQVLKNPKLKAPEKKAGTHRAAQKKS